MLSQKSLTGDLENISPSSSSLTSSSSTSISSSSSSSLFSPKHSNLSASSGKNGSINSLTSQPVVSSSSTSDKDNEQHLHIDPPSDTDKDTVQKYHLETPEDSQLSLTKKDIQEAFAKYLVGYKINFLGLIGPKHKNRAKAVLAAINLAKDPETIHLIIDNQLAQVLGKGSVSAPQLISDSITQKLHEVVQLDERWTNPNCMVNKPVVEIDPTDHTKADLAKLEKKSGYYRMLKDADSKLQILLNKKTYVAFA